MNRILIAGCSCILLFSACQQRQTVMLDRLQSLDAKGYNGQPASPAHIKELKAALDKYRKIVAEKVSAADSATEYYKMLALAYIEDKMYGLALDALSDAVRLEPENPVLFYYAGVSAARMGKGELNPQTGQTYLDRAERYYRRAIALDPTYSDAEYGLGVLLTFELNRPLDAEPVVKQLLQQQKNDTDAMFLLARIYVVTGRVEDAASLYEKIAQTTRDAQVRQQAEQNRKQLLERNANG
ncbi:MAG TPA: tetratricopeptide repeat protein [Spirochaetia bacterium]|nr:tetratricopeptide repeat protein [Spirochaetia bacterium]